MQAAWKRILLIVLGWRLLLFLIGAVAPQFFAYQGSFSTPSVLQNYQLPAWVNRWASFDGVHYLSIIEQGYKKIGLIQAFFPIYPLLAKWLGLLINNNLLSLLIINNLATLLALYLIYVLNQQYFKRSQQFLPIILFLIFPSSFFLGAAYSEGLFLLWIFAAFYFFGQKKFWPTALFIALASATRIVGIILLPAMLIDLFYQNKKKIDYSASFILCVGALGLVSYMGYLWVNFNDPFYFLTVQSQFGAGRQSQLVIWPQVVWRYLKIIFTVRPIDWKYFAYVQEFCLSLIGLYYLIKAFLKKELPLAWILFALGAYFMPTLTGNFSSMPRYILVCWPIFFYLAKDFSRWKPQAKILYLTISLLLLIINSMLFIQGYWVA